MLGILTAQAALSVRLFWTNTAFQDEALYLWSGHLEWAHWLHGSPLPTSFPTFLSGAPVIYPPLGAIADSIGGLAGARALSLCFMLGATTLLYAVTRRIFGRPAAFFAAGLFAGPVLSSSSGRSPPTTRWLCSCWRWPPGSAAGGRRRPAGRYLLLAGTAVALASPTPPNTRRCCSTRWLSLSSCCSSGSGTAAAAPSSRRWSSSGGQSPAAAPCWSVAPVPARDRVHDLRPAAGPRPGTRNPVRERQMGRRGGRAGRHRGRGSASTRTRPAKALASSLAVAVFLAPAEQARIHVSPACSSMWPRRLVRLRGRRLGIAALASAVPPAKVRAALRTSAAAVLMAAVPGVFLASFHFSAGRTVTPLIAALRARLPSESGADADGQLERRDYYLPAVARLAGGDDHLLLHLRRSADRDDMTQPAAAYAAAIQNRFFSVIALVDCNDATGYDPAISCSDREVRELPARSPTFRSGPAQKPGTS